MTEEEDLLMPGSAPLPSLRRLDDRPAHGYKRRYGTNETEHEYAALADQLRALKHDIGDARTVSRDARRTPGHAEHGSHEVTHLFAPRGAPVTLPDGEQILIRPIERGDAELLKAAFEHLGEVSRYRRFLTTIDHLTTAQLAYLTDVDHETHEALVALDPRSGESLGIASYVCDPDHQGQAEVVVVIADLWQGRGAGSALARRLSARARAAGIECFTSRMLIGNEAGRRLLAHVADTIGEHENGATTRLIARVRVPRDHDHDHDGGTT